LSDNRRGRRGGYLIKFAVHDVDIKEKNRGSLLQSWKVFLVGGSRGTAMTVQAYILRKLWE
jgi:hypothetical protein